MKKTNTSIDDKSVGVFLYSKLNLQEEFYYEENLEFARKNNNRKINGG